MVVRRSDVGRKRGRRGRGRECADVRVIERFGFGRARACAIGIGENPSRAQTGTGRGRDRGRVTISANAPPPLPGPCTWATPTLLLTKHRPLASPVCPAPPSASFVSLRCRLAPPIPTVLSRSQKDLAAPLAGSIHRPLNLRCYHYVIPFSPPQPRCTHVRPLASLPRTPSATVFVFGHNDTAP